MLGHDPRGFRLGLVWDVSDPSDMLWRNEMSVGGAPWMLVEGYHMTPVG